MITILLNPYIGSDSMKLGLGIDTGGTYTDGVIYDFHSKKVIKDAKSVTVKEDLKGHY